MIMSIIIYPFFGGKSLKQCIKRRGITPRMRRRCRKDSVSDSGDVTSASGRGVVIVRWLKEILGTLRIKAPNFVHLFTSTYEVISG